MRATDGWLVDFWGMWCRIAAGGGIYWLCGGDGGW
jgi:hypothetical protein